MAKEDFVSLVETGIAFEEMIRNIRFIKENEVYVGIPDDTTDRENIYNKEVTNADLLFIHTNGSQAKNIPKRPVIEPAIKKDFDRISRMMKKALDLAMNRKYNEAIDQLKRVGMRGQNVSRAYFVDEDNGWPPNSPATAARKRAKGSDNPRPLIDTGELRKSITYFVGTKGGRIK